MLKFPCTCIHRHNLQLARPQLTLIPGVQLLLDCLILLSVSELSKMVTIMKRFYVNYSVLTLIWTTKTFVPVFLDFFRKSFIYWIIYIYIFFVCWYYYKGFFCETLCVKVYDRQIFWYFPVAKVYVCETKTLPFFLAVEYPLTLLRLGFFYPLRTGGGHIVPPLRNFSCAEAITMIFCMCIAMKIIKILAKVYFQNDRPFCSDVIKYEVR